MPPAIRNGRRSVRDDGLILASPAPIHVPASYVTKMNAQGMAVERLSVATGFSPSARRAQEMLPPDIPGYLVPIVEALLSGQTDEAVCRRLGLSSRTFSRRVAELLEYLSVITRFQGGAELVLRGYRDRGAASSALVAQPDLAAASVPPPDHHGRRTALASSSHGRSAGRGAAYSRRDD
jgi:hypothetical protein